MVDLARGATPGRRRTSADGVPEDIAQALDASAEDLRHDRTDNLRDFVKRMDAKLEAHLARKSADRH